MSRNGFLLTCCGEGGCIDMRMKLVMQGKSRGADVLDSFACMIPWTVGCLQVRDGSDMNK
jgi:hypothetical protein